MTRWLVSPFFNEADVFEIRLGVMGDWADRIIVAEGDLTYAGAKRELVFPQHAERWRPWAKKISYVPVEMPVFEKEHFSYSRSFQAGTGGAWKREELLRNAPLSVMEDLHPDDFVFLSDADEIVRPELLEERELVDPQLYSPILWNLPQHVMHLNWRWPDEVGAVARLVSGRSILESNIQSMVRDVRISAQSTKRCGWHFSYMGGKDMVVHKIKQAAHQELAHHADDEEHIERCLRTGRDMFKRTNRGAISVPLTELPTYVGKNLSKFVHLFGPEIEED